MGGLTPQQEVLHRSGRRCCLCFGLHGVLVPKKGQIAHLDHNHENNVAGNLAFLCLEHHDEYDTRTSQSKGWTIEEAQRYRALLYEAIEELRANPKKRMVSISHQHELPIFGRILGASSVVMDAVGKNSGHEYSGVSAFPLSYGSRFTFDVTNPNPFDLRITRLYVDVIKYIETEILGLSQGDLGGAMTFRELGCEIEPKVGRYVCHHPSEGFDYIRLSSGEMEAFRIIVEVVKEGIYRLRLGMEYSIAGETRTIEVDNDILEFGVFDSVFHQPSQVGDQRLADEAHFA